MQPTLLRSHLTAWLAGIILALYCSLFSQGPFAPYFVLMGLLNGLPSFVALIFLGIIGVITLLGIIFLRRLANKLGPYWAFMTVTGMLALAISFAFAYMGDLDTWMPATGEVHGFITAPDIGPRPRDWHGQFIVFTSVAIWIAIMVMVALVTRRVPETFAKMSPPSRWPLIGWIACDCILIGCVTFTYLKHELDGRTTWVKPENVAARASAILHNPAASPGDRAWALNSIEHNPSEETTKLLEEIAHRENDPLRLEAATHLLGHDDKTALPLLDDSLMQSTHPTGTVQPTTALANPSGGMVRVMGFGTLGPQSYGNNLASVKDPAAVPILAHLMSSPDPATRKGAASALRNILTLKERGWDRWVPAWPKDTDVTAATDALVSGLDDKDEMVRYFSVCTLMEINGNPHYPAVRIFQDNEAAYLDGWKAWARQRKPKGE